MTPTEQLEHDYPDFNYESIVRRNDNAIQFDIYGDGTKKVWLPTSQLELDERIKEFNIPRWLAEQKELI